MTLGTIQTGTGLATGMDIQGTVDKLMAINAKPRDNLKTATDGLTTEKSTLTKLAALLYAIKVPTTSLGKATTYQERAATSSNANALAASVTGTPAIGTYEYTPLRMATAQKLLSSGFASDSEAIGKGKMTIRFGDRVDRSGNLGAANGGKGLVRGSMRITDGSGETANIDLSTAQTIDEVLDAINKSTAINVTATTINGHIHLVDNSGGSSHLKVEDIGSGKTAASLGLAGIDSATGSADGQEILTLYEGISLNTLNDGLGVEVSPTLGDISYTLRDGTTGTLDFAPGSNSSSGVAETTLKQIIDRVNTQSEGKLKLSIAADGASLVMTDMTSGAGTFSLQSTYGSLALQDLGLDGTSVDGTITGRRILGGLKTVTLGSLNGGKGLGTLGSITLTDRSGATGTIDLQNARTLDDVIQKINSSTNVRIHAQVNQAGNGIQLIDQTGSSTGSMVVADADATNTATKLKIKAGSGATSLASINSGDMHLKIIGENTLLSTLNGGAGMTKGSITITNAKGKSATIDLSKIYITTMGDVIRAINRQGINVSAELNDTGDGILLRDTGGGKGTLSVSESGSNTAKSLGLLGKTATAGTNGYLELNGSMTYVVDIYDIDTLANVNSQINGLGGNFSSTIITDGSAQPYHLSITSKLTGKAGSMVIDTSGASFTVDELTKGQDSQVLVGPQTAKTTAVITNSSTNTYTNLVDGLKLTVKQATGETVDVNVTSSSSSLSAAVKVFVDNYNKYHDELAADTKYDAENNKAATLTYDATTFNFDTGLTTLLSGLFTGAGKYASMADFGITFAPDGSGSLQYDDTVLQNAIESDPDAVKEFFTTKDNGFSAKIGKLIEQFAGANKSMLENRLDALQKKIDGNKKRIDEMNAMLEKQKETLLLQFYNMDLAVSKSQTSLKALDSIAWMANNLYGNSTSSSSSNS